MLTITRVSVRLNTLTAAPHVAGLSDVRVLLFTTGGGKGERAAALVDLEETRGSERREFEQSGGWKLPIDRALREALPLLFGKVYAVVPTANKLPSLQLQAFVRMDLRQTTATTRVALQSFFHGAEDEGAYTVSLEYRASEDVPRSPVFSPPSDLAHVAYLYPEETVEQLMALPFPERPFVAASMDRLANVTWYNENGTVLPLYGYALRSEEPGVRQFDDVYVRRAGELALMLKFGCSSDEAASRWTQLPGAPLLEVLDVLLGMTQLYTMSTRYTQDVSRVDLSGHHRMRLAGWAFDRDTGRYQQSENMCHMPVTHSGDCEEGAFMNAHFWQDIIESGSSRDPAIRRLCEVARNYVPHMALVVYTHGLSGGHMTFCALRKPGADASLPPAVMADSISLMHSAYSEPLRRSQARRAFRARLDTALQADANSVLPGASADILWQVVRLDTENTHNGDSTPEMWLAVLRLFAVTAYAPAHSRIPYTAQTRGAFMHQLLSGDPTVLFFDMHADNAREIVRLKTPICKLMGKNTVLSTDKLATPENTALFNIAVDTLASAETVATHAKRCGAKQTRILRTQLGEETPMSVFVQCVIAVA